LPRPALKFFAAQADTSIQAALRGNHRLRTQL
jgi:hypothetical protein